MYYNELYLVMKQNQFNTDPIENIGCYYIVT